VKSLEEESEQYCVCATCNKVTAYKEAWRFASALGGNKCFPCIVATLK